MTAKKTNIVYIDDDPDMLALIKIVLEKNSEISVKVFSSPGQALAHIDHAPPDLVIMDYFLPGTNGIEIMQRVRARRPDIPFVCFTAESAPEEIARIKAMGFAKVVIKPVDIDKLPDSLLAI